MGINLKITIIFVLILFAKNADANGLFGEWEQDINAQSEFNNLNVILTAKDKSILDCGKQTMRIKKNVLVVSHRKVMCDIGGKNIVIYPYEYTYYFRVVYSNDDVVALEVTNEAGEGSHIEIYHFISNDKFWLYYYGNETNGSSHLRMYFKRASKGTR